MFWFFNHSIIGKFHLILSIFFPIFILILCEHENLVEIKKNYFQIIHLLDQQSLKFYGNNSLIICSYDYEFSNKINEKNSDNLKYTLCLIKSQSSAYLYLINNNIESPISIFNANNSNILVNNNLNLIPYLDNNNNLTCLIIALSDYMMFGSYIEIYKYKINLTSNNINIILYENYSYPLNVISTQYAIGNIILDKNNRKLILPFLNEQNINILFIDIDRENITRFIDNCTNCFNTNEHNGTTFLSSSIINKEKNIIFSCYKFYEQKAICFFFNNNYLIYKKDIEECESNIKNYYFYETKEYIVICQEKNLISIYKMDYTNLNQNFTYSNTNINKHDCISSNNFFISYNSSLEKYHLIYDCYDNYTYKYIKNITEPKNKGFITDTAEIIVNNINSGRIVNKLEDILNNFTINLEKSIYIGKHYVLNSDDENYKLYIRPLDTTYNLISSNIDFSECKNLLKSYKSLNLFMLEIENPNLESLTNKIEYKIFDENYEEVNLSVCENINITIKYKRKQNEAEINTEEISYYRGFGINLFNINDDFFQKLCRPYPDIEYDVILKDRVELLYNRYSVCDDGCFFESIDDDFITCNCPVKNYINTTIGKVEFGEIPKTFPKYYEIITCYKLVFSQEDKINNLGFYLITFMLGGHVPIWCYYLSTGVKPTNDYISKEMLKYGYITKRKKSKCIRANNKKKTKNKITNKKVKKNKKNRKLDSPPLKKANKKENKSNIKKKITKKGKKNIKKKNNTFIQACYIINNNNKHDTIDNNNKIENKKIKKGIKKGKKGKKAKKPIISKKIKKSKIDNISNNNSNKSFEPNLMETQNIDYLYNGDEEEKNYDDFDFIHIKLDRNEENEPRKESNKILNNYIYEEAIEYDQRSFCKIFFIFILSKNIIFKTLFLKSPFDSISVLGCAFIFFVSSDLFFNCLFYSDKNVSIRFINKENLFYFTFSTNMPNIFYSLFVLYGIVIILYLLINMPKKIRDIFQIEEEKLKKDKNYTVSEERKKKILNELEQILNTQNKKNYAFFISELILLLLYWYYITAFCHIYSNSQYSWVLNTFLTLVFIFLIDSFICFFLSALYKCAIGQKSKSLYNAILFVYNI